MVLFRSFVCFVFRVVLNYVLQSSRLVISLCWLCGFLYCTLRLYLLWLAPADVWAGVNPIFTYFQWQRHLFFCSVLVILQVPLDLASCLPLFHDHRRLLWIKTRISHVESTPFFHSSYLPFFIPRIVFVDSSSFTPVDESYFSILDRKKLGFQPTASQQGRSWRPWGLWLRLGRGVMMGATVFLCWRSWEIWGKSRANTWTFKYRF